MSPQHTYLYNTNSPTNTVYTYTFEADTAVLQSYMTGINLMTLFYTHICTALTVPLILFTHTLLKHTAGVQCLSVRAWF